MANLGWRKDNTVIKKNINSREIFIGFSNHIIKMSQRNLFIYLNCVLKIKRKSKCHFKCICSLKDLCIVLYMQPRLRKQAHTHHISRSSTCIHDKNDRLLCTENFSYPSNAQQIRYNRTNCYINMDGVVNGRLV